MLTTHYDALQVAHDASDAVIRAAYKCLAQKYHPDRYDGPPAEADQKTKMLNEAYSVLSDPERRKQYNESIAVRERSAASSAYSKVRRKMAARPFPAVAVAMIVVVGIVAGILHHRIHPADAKATTATATGTAEIKIRRGNPPATSAASGSYSPAIQDLREKCKPPHCRIVQ